MENKEKNEVVQELISIIKGSGTTVDYSTTVFGSSYNEYVNTVESNIGSQIYEKTKSKIWNTSLVFEPMIGKMFYESEKDKGVNFGWYMLNYISRKPQVCTVITFNGNNNYTYKSATFDKESKGFVNSQNESLTVTTVRELTEFMLSKFNIDLDKYIEVKEPKKQN